MMSTDQRTVRASPRHGEAIFVKTILAGLRLAAFSLLAISTASAAPDWCNPTVKTYTPGFFDYIRGESLPAPFFTVGIYSPNGPYTQAVTMAVSGAGSVTCTPVVGGNAFSCPFNSTLTEGAHTASYTCTAVNQDGSSAGNDTESIGFTMDNTAPIVTISGPSQGAVFSPYSTITVSGIIQDITPLTNVGADSSNGPPSASRVNGNTFEFDFCLTSSTNNFFSANSTGPLTVYIGAFDSVGLGAYAGNGGLSSITVAIDGVPPAVAVSSPIGIVKTFSEISGTANDASGISELQIGIRNSSTGKYWNGTVFVDAPFFAAVSGISGGPGVKQWSFPIQSAALPSGQSFGIYLKGRDSLGNLLKADTPSATFTIPTGPTLIAAGNSINVAGLVTFTPNIRDIPYGRSLDLCAEIAPSADPTLKGVAATQMTFEIQSGAIKAFGANQGDSTRLPGSCGQNGIPIRIYSDSKKCLPSDKIIAKVYGATAGSVDISVLLPTETNSVMGPGGADHVDQILHPNLQRCTTDPLSTDNLCAFDYYDMTVSRNNSNLDLDQQTYREFVLPPHRLVLGPAFGGTLDFCRNDHTTNVTQQNPNIKVFADKLGTMDADKVGIVGRQTNSQVALVDWQKMSQVIQFQKAYACGAETLQFWRMNACRIPRDPKIFIRQRTKIIVMPDPKLPKSVVIATFLTSKSDEHASHNTLDSQ